MRVCELIEWLKRSDPLSPVGVIVPGFNEPVEIDKIGDVALLGYVGIHITSKEIR